MSKIRVIVADTDKEYAETLSGYLIDKSMQLFRITCFTDETCLMDFINSNSEEADVILTGEYYLPALEEFAKNRNIPLVILSNSYESIGADNTIYKYCNADIITEKLKDSIKKTCVSLEIIKEGEAQTKNLVFFSPSGNSGCTFLAVNSALSLVKSRKKVLYFNLEAVNSTGFYLSVENEDEGYGLADIIFDLRENSGNFAESIEKGIIQSNGVSYFRPKENFIEKSDMRIEDIEYILSSIMEKQIYDFIVTDLGNIFGKGKINLLNRSDAIFLVSNTDDHSIFKLMELINGIGLYGVRNSLNLEGRTNVIWNMARDSDFTKELAGEFGKNQSTLPAFSDRSIPEEYINKILKDIKYG